MRPGSSARVLRSGIAIITGLILVAMAGCGSGDEPSTDAAADRTELTILAAASLTDSFTEIGSKFEQDHSGVTVRFSFGSSSTLAQQVTEGAPADVFASANEDTMQTVVDAGLTRADPQLFVTNTLRIAVPAGNPGAVQGLEDFADSNKKTALCAEQVPCGAAAQEVFANAGITPQPVTYEKDVKAALQKVVQGEVDAAMVYATDVAAAGDEVEGIDFDGSDAVVNNYPLAALKESAHPEQAQEFVDYVRSDTGQQILQQAGFGAP